MPEPATAPAAPRVGIVMGSDSDWAVMQAAATALEEFGISYEADVVSAHRMPDAMINYGRHAHGRGLAVIIAGAGGAAHLPGMLAAVTPLPVIGVPVPLAYLDGMDSLLSIIQMPAGVPVAAVAIGGARNAGLLAVRILAAADPALQQRMVAFQDQLRQAGRVPRGRPSGPTHRTGAASPADGGRCRGVGGRGAGLLVKGLSLITHRPRLFLLGAIPPVITSVIFSRACSLHRSLSSIQPSSGSRRSPTAGLGASRDCAARARRQCARRGCRAADGDLVHHLDPCPRLAAV